MNGSNEWNWKRPPTWSTIMGSSTGIIFTDSTLHTGTVVSLFVELLSESEIQMSHAIRKGVFVH